LAPEIIRQIILDRAIFNWLDFFNEIPCQRVADVVSVEGKLTAVEEASSVSILDSKNAWSYHF
jgi:hypothetical protein